MMAWAPPPASQVAPTFGKLVMFAWSDSVPAPRPLSWEPAASSASSAQQRPTQT